MYSSLFIEMKFYFVNSELKTKILKIKDNLRKKNKLYVNIKSFKFYFISPMRLNTNYAILEGATF